MEIAVTELDAEGVEIMGSVHALVGFADARRVKESRKLRVTGFVFTSEDGTRVSIQMEADEMRELRRLMDMAIEGT